MRESSTAEEPQVVSSLRTKFGPAIHESSQFRGELTVRVDKDYIVEICLFLRDEPHYRFNFLTDLCGVDYPARSRRFDVVYLLYSIPYNRRLRLKAAVGEDETIPSVVSVWRAANWLEREAYDMFGIRFSGHPDLRRILLPEDWEAGWPLRKDYPLEGYRVPL
jgi:NADH/F420H2 dehydrogenase subunit C